MKSPEWQKTYHLDLAPFHRGGPFWSSREGTINEWCYLWRSKEI
jgi:hypothetical protein